MTSDDLHTWAARYPEAAAALAALYPDMRGAADATDGKLEDVAMSAIARRASADGDWLMRNNSGAFQDDTGRWIRFGLGNVSKPISKVVKSSDFVGIRPVRIGPQHVGTLLGQFTAVEAKRPGWRYTGTQREMAQRAFGLKVVSMGGLFRFDTGESA